MRCSLQVFAGEDLQDEGAVWWGRGGDGEGLAEHVLGLVEPCGIFGEESDDGLATLQVVAEFGVHFDAGVCADGIAGAGAAGAETLNGPSDLLAVHAAEEACLRGVYRALGGGFVLGERVFEDGGVAALCLDDAEPGGVGGAAAEKLLRDGDPFFGGRGAAGEVEHVTGQCEGELDEVVAERVGMALKDLDALGDFDPVAGKAAEGLVHAREESDGLDAGFGAGLDHEAGEFAGLIDGGQECSGTDFDVEDESVERLGEFLAHDAGGDEEGRLDGAGVVAHGVEEAVGGGERRGLTDERGTGVAKDLAEADEGELGVEAGDGFEFVEGAAGVAEAATGDHGDADGRCARGGEAGHTSGGEDGGDEERGLVADAAGGVLVHRERVKRCRVEDLTGEAHGLSEGCELAPREAVLIDGHEESAELCVRDGGRVGRRVSREVIAGRCICEYRLDEEADLGIGELASGAFAEDEIDGVEGRCVAWGHVVLFVTEEVTIRQEELFGVGTRREGDRRECIAGRVPNRQELSRGRGR